MDTNSDKSVNYNANHVYNERMINRNSEIILSDDDIAFFDSLPILDTELPLEGISKLNPFEIGKYIFDNHSHPMPNNVYTKFMTDREGESSIYIKNYENIPKNVSESIRGIFPINSEYGINVPKVIYENRPANYHVLCIRTFVSNKQVFSICSISGVHFDLDLQPDVELKVIGTKQSAGRYTFVNESTSSVNLGSNWPLKLSFLSTECYISNVNKSTIRGYESGSTNVKIALAICSLFNPNAYYDIVITDSAIVRCGDNERIELTDFLFFTAKFRLSWYNSFGFGPTRRNTNIEKLQMLQTELQSLNMMEIASYLEGLLLDIENNPNIYIVSAAGIDKPHHYKESWKTKIRLFIDTIRKEPLSLRDFLLKKGHCRYYNLLFQYKGPVPKLYINNNGERPIVKSFPRYNDFLYVFSNLGGSRIIRGKGVPTENNARRSMNKNNVKKRKTRKRVHF